MCVNVKRGAERLELPQKVVRVHRRDDVVVQPFRVLGRSRSMVRETLESYFLFRHELASVFIHLRVMDAKSAENREGFEN